MKNPEGQIESILRESTRSLVQHITAIHGYLQLLQCQEMSAQAQSLVRKLMEQDQRACAVLETLIGLEQSHKNILAHSISSPAQLEPQAVQRQGPPQQLPIPKGSGRVLLVGNDGAALEFQRTVLLYLGGEVSFESQPENLRARLLEEDFELILIDELCMSASQADDLGKWIAEKRGALKDRVVFLSAGALNNAFERLGFRTLRKPLQIPELIECSRELLPKIMNSGKDTVQ